MSPEQQSQIEALPGVALAAFKFLAAFREFRDHPDNDTTKAFDRKLMAREIAEEKLEAALEAAGFKVNDDG